MDKYLGPLHACMHVYESVVCVCVIVYKCLGPQCMHSRTCVCERGSDVCVGVFVMVYVNEPRMCVKGNEVWHVPQCV